MTESLSEEEVSTIVSNVAETYGVDEADVSVEVVYQTTGTMQVTIPNDVSLEELEASLEDELSELLGVHESLIEVVVSEDGTVTYVVSSDTVELAEEVQHLLSDEIAVSTLSSGLTEQLGATLSSVSVDDVVTADVVVTVDTTDASNNLSSAKETLVEEFSSAGYSASAESNLVPTFRRLFFCF